VTTAIAVVAIVLFAAWGVDRWRNRLVWGKKSAEELSIIISGAEWRKWELALEEFKRRGHDATAAVSLVGGRLLSESHWERSAARMVLMKVYPETRPLLKEYRPTDDDPTRRKVLAPFFAEYKREDVIKQNR
jgi:hypothetical protein